MSHQVLENERVDSQRPAMAECAAEVVRGGEFARGDLGACMAADVGKELLQMSQRDGEWLDATGSMFDAAEIAGEVWRDAPGFVSAAFLAGAG